MNTLISGQILDPDGNPVTDQWVDLETNIGEDYNSLNYGIIPILIQRSLFNYGL